MEIAPVTKLAVAIANAPAGLCLSTDSAAVPAAAVAEQTTGDVTLFIGPEGGWADFELLEMSRKNFASVALTRTILRVETAAVTAAGVLLCLAAARESAKIIPTL
jgi:RsmE family RNA methyltransferase